MSKNLEKAQNNGKHGIAKVSAIIIVLVSISSVIGGFYIYNTQAFVESNTDLANQMTEIGDAVVSDIDGIIQTELPKIQETNSLFQDVMRINKLIGNLKLVNTTGGSNITITANEIEQLAVEAVGYMELTWKILETTYAYSWTTTKGGTEINNYTVYGEENYLIANVYPEFAVDLEPEIVYYTAILYPQTKLGRIYEENWYNIMYIDLGIVANYGDIANDTATKYDFNLTRPDFNYYSFQNNAFDYIEKSSRYEQSISLMSTSILLLAIAAVIVGFLVQIDIKKLKKICLIVGIFVMIIAIGIFGIAIFVY